MADILLYQLVRREFQHLMPDLSFDDPREQQKKELQEFLRRQQSNAKLSLQSESQDLG